jgi:hypothetical protein
MLPLPFISEIPYGLGDDTAWLGRDVMHALQHLRRNQYSDLGPGATIDAWIHRPNIDMPSVSAIYQDDLTSECVTIRGCLQPS